MNAKTRDEPAPSDDAGVVPPQMGCDASGGLLLILGGRRRREPTALPSTPILPLRRDSA